MVDIAEKLLISNLVKCFKHTWLARISRLVFQILEREYELRE
jgi:hypothetical protein